MLRFSSYWKKSGHKKWASPGVIGVLLLLIVWAFGALFVYFVTNPGLPKSASGQNTGTLGTDSGPTGPIFRRLIDGLSVAPDATNPALYAVMIDNATDARPQSGLAAASLVYEVLVESNITRFIAVYPSDIEVKKIGPVRSARQYAVELVSDLSPLYLHVGGSPDALTLLAKTKHVLNVDEFAFGRYFRRALERKSPHNVYTESTSLLALINKLARPAFTPTSWQYREERKSEERTGTTGVKISFGTPAYEAAWRYSKDTNSYVRYQGRSRYRDQDASEVHAKNVAVIIAESAVLDHKGRRSMRIVGSGEAYVLSEGVAIKGSWKKDAPESRMQFFDHDGKEISFIPGTTWIEVAVDSASVSITE